MGVYHMEPEGHAYQSILPSQVHVVVLITFTPEPPSTMHPDMSWPRRIILMTGLW